MMELLKLHLQLVKNPSAEIKNHITNWPLPLGIAVYTFYSVRSYFQTGNSYSMLRDLLAGIYGIQSDFLFFLYIIITIGYSLIIYYYLLPILVRLFSGQSNNEFNPTPYRKLIFYSPTSYVIYIVYILLPIQILLSLYLFFFEADTLAIVFGVIYGLLNLWSLVLIINLFVIQWKGLKIFYNIKGIKTFFIVFILPLIGFIPMILIYGQKLIDYITSSIG